MDILKQFKAQGKTVLAYPVLVDFSQLIFEAIKTIAGTLAEQACDSER